MADLDNGEFDFDSTPPVGGPLENLPEVHAQMPDVLSDLDNLEALDFHHRLRRACEQML